MFYVTLRIQQITHDEFTEIVSRKKNARIRNDLVNCKLTQ